MPDPQPQQDPTVQDIIRDEAMKAGVPPELALAIAQQESGFNPTVTGPRLPNGESAIGTMQLLPSTAASLGVDPTDPRQNIAGGVKYLRQLLDRHQGDLGKVLGEYGGVRTNTTYVPQVLGRIGAFQTAAPAMAPVAAVGTPPPGTTPPQPAAQPQKNLLGQPVPAGSTDLGMGGAIGGKVASAVKGVADGFNPMTRTGRRNLAGGIGAVAAIPAAVALSPELAVAGLAGTALSVGGAALGGAAAETGEQVVGREPINPTEIAKAGAEQGALDLAGHGMLWVPRALTRRLVASSVSKQAFAHFSQAKQATLDTLQAGLDTVSKQIRDYTHATRPIVAGNVRAAQAAGKQGVEAATAAGAARIAGEEAAHANLVATPPDAVLAGRQANAVIQGQARDALDLSGKRVEEAAASGPGVDITRLKAEAQRILEKEIRPPQEAFPRATTEAATAAEITAQTGIAPERIVELEQRAATGSKVAADNLATLQAAVAAAQGEGQKEILKHPALGTITRILNAADEVPFADAHAFKKELDDSLKGSWDQTVKKRVTSLTQHLRTELRQALAGHEPYNVATAAYAQTAKLFEKGYAPRLRKIALDSPEALVSMITPKNPTRAAMLTKLLTETAAEGGGEAEGRQALEAVQAAWVHQKLITGPLEKLGERVDALSPEFRQAFLGDPKAQQVLSNLKTIHAAYLRLQEQAAKEVAAAKTAGVAGVQTASKTGKAALADARYDVATELQKGRIALREASKTTPEQQAFLESTVGPKQVMKPEDTLAHAARVIGLGLFQLWGGLSAMRLLKGPSAKDLIEYAAFSNEWTKAWVTAATSQRPGQAVADLLRAFDAANVVRGNDQSWKPKGRVGVPPPPTTPPISSRPGSQVGAPPPR